MNYSTKLALASISLIALACKNKPQFASIEGTIQNIPKNVTEVFIRSQDKIKKIALHNGTFKDTLSFDGEFAYLQIGNLGKTLFLDKNTQLVVNADAKKFEQSLTYSGNGEKVNSYLHKREQITLQVFEKIDSINKLSAEKFEHYLNQMTQNIESLLKTNNDIPKKVIKTERESLPVFIENLKNQYQTVNGLTSGLQPGDDSPTFSYENYKGGTTNLADLKGSYVYIDVWATWCPPCKAEIPYLKKLDKKFHGKNIQFVSISVDSPNAKDKWTQMIKDKKMGGIQLFANGDESFMQAYQITGIPRFILLDTNGKIIDANAIRPSNPNLEKQLTNLLKK